MHCTVPAFPALLTVVNSSLANSLLQSYNPHLAFIPFYLLLGILQLQIDEDLQTNFHAFPAVPENTRHLFPMLLLITDALEALRLCAI